LKKRYSQGPTNKRILTIQIFLIKLIKKGLAGKMIYKIKLIVKIFKILQIPLRLLPDLMKDPLRDHTRDPTIDRMIDPTVDLMVL
jgi:hypothetical protein